MELLLVDSNPEVTVAWSRHFTDLPKVTVINGRFEDVAKYDCIVSPANSFGLMDGGIDLAISEFFGWDLMSRVQERIVLEFYGEQPVGTSLIVETGHDDYPYLAHTPTMRIPTDISNTDNCYLAMSAMLRAVSDFNRRNVCPIGSVLCPGLGTATGRMMPDVAAYQMALAYRYFLNPPASIDWNYAWERDDALSRTC